MNETLKTNSEFDINHTDLSLAELRKQYPKELKEWCLSVEGNGDSDIEVDNRHFLERHFRDGSFADSRGSYDIVGEEIGHGPLLQAKDFLHAMQAKNPDNSVFAFAHTKQAEGKSGTEYYIVTDADFDTLNLPDGYGFRAGGPDNYDYKSSCQADEDMGQVVCHEETFMLSVGRGGAQSEKINFETGKLNMFKTDGVTEATKSQKGQEFPEQFRIIVKKKESDKDPWLQLGK